MTKLRVLGEALNRSTVEGNGSTVNVAWLDIAVDNVDIDGTVQVSEVDGGRTWTTDIDTISQWRDDNEAVKHTNVANLGDGVWTATKNMGKASSSSANKARQGELWQCATDAVIAAIDAQAR